MTSPKSAKVSKMDTTIRSWTANPILDTEFTEEPSLQEVYVGILKERKNISTAIQSISAVLPGFAHLKRCSNGKLLLAPFYRDESSRAEERVILSEGQLKNQLREKGFDLSLLVDKFQIMEVPAKAPRTKSQANKASKIWPVNFHPDPSIESLVDGSIFDEEHLLTIEKIMLLVIKAAALEAIGDERCTGAAAVIDPEDGKILTISAARIDRHPMWHAAMLAVDLVARLHGGGAWKLDLEAHGDTTRRRTSNKEEMLGEKKADSTARSEDPKTRLKKIKRRYEEDTPLCYPRSLSSLPFPAQIPFKMQAARKGRNNNGTKIENSKQEDRRDDIEKCGPYLCTGYWVFLLTEPCPLCAMALLHSRVARIFYGTGNPAVGILGSRAILHTVPGLNHRYQVWSGILEQECRRTVSEINARGTGTESRIRRRLVTEDNNSESHGQFISVTSASN